MATETKEHTNALNFRAFWLLLHRVFEVPSQRAKRSKVEGILFMSGLLAGKVWQSNLSSHLKPLAAALADIANDDGTSIYPSVAYVAWLLGKGRRSVQIGLSELRDLQIIEPVGSDKGGRGQTTEYRLIEANLPKRQSWQELRKGAEDAPFTETKGAVSDTKGRISEHERAHSTTERAQPSAPDPSVEPSTEPLVEPSPEIRVFNFWKEHMNHPRAVFDDKRRKAVVARLRAGYSVDDLILAVRGCKLTPHNMGQNERQSVFDDLELICRDTSHVERFMAKTETNGNGHYTASANVANIQAGLEYLDSLSEN